MTLFVIVGEAPASTGGCRSTQRLPVLHGEPVEHSPGAFLVCEGDDWSIGRSAVDDRLGRPSNARGAGGHRDGFALEIDQLVVRSGRNQNRISGVRRIDPSLNRRLILRYMNRCLCFPYTTEYTHQQDNRKVRAQFP
jgi:hypothetical protein